MRDTHELILTFDISSSNFHRINMMFKVSNPFILFFFFSDGPVLMNIERLQDSDQ